VAIYGKEGGQVQRPLLNRFENYSADGGVNCHGDFSGFVRSLNLEKQRRKALTDK